MRYMYLISALEDGKPPPQRLMEEIMKSGEQAMAEGRMISTGGLVPLMAGGGARVELRRGKLKVHDGPFTETKEVIGGFAIFEFATREEALKSAVDFMELHRLYGEGWEGVCEMRAMYPVEVGCAAQQELAKTAETA
ncbi:MAG TPA: YciI family protein [Vitreimonas sp.]|uniref:YciI family protein n=1 Tax=Vitreimonas sp. TaxID=3069702 RepID=UPI002D27D486|nr:YciI family protein [Vitreimonas sp.]HYD87663.1 YciI family protein [Vitreimonas sp.]